MSLSIVLSNDDGKPFLPGSMVLGVVKLVTFDDQAIDEVTINFRGRASVLLVHSYGDMTTSRRDYKSVGYLFSQHLTLYQGKYTHRKGSYMWPFAFYIPLSASPRAGPFGSNDFFCPEYPWKNDNSVELHPLPPSMSESGRFLCAVEYMLQATLSRPRRNPIPLSKNISTVKQVQVQPFTRKLDLNVSGDWPYANYRHNVQCALGNRSRTLPARLWSSLCERRRRFKRLSTPKVELHVSVLMPKKLILKEQVALSVLVAATAYAIDSDIATDQTSESVHLHSKNLTITSFKVSLLQRTQVRAGCHRSSSKKRIFVRKGSCILPLSGNLSLASTQSGITNQDTGAVVSVNLADIADLTVSSTTFVPDFSTYNIARSHSLEMLFKMEYENKRFKFYLRDIPIRVLSPECDRMDQSGGQPSERTGGQSTSDEVWIVPPPAACAVDNDDDAIDALHGEPPPPYRAR